MPARRCRVIAGPDPIDGLVHEIEVEATTLYEATIAGLEALQREEWTPPHVGENTPLTILVLDTGVSHRVRVKAVKAWLARTAGSPNEIAQRRRLRERLK
jgi:hypothetical protein